MISYHLLLCLTSFSAYLHQLPIIHALLGMEDCPQDPYPQYPESGPVLISAPSLNWARKVRAQGREPTGGP